MATLTIQEQTQEAQAAVAQGLNPALAILSIGGNITKTSEGFAQTRKSLQNLPSAAEAGKAFSARIAAENRQDVETPLRSLSMAETGHLTRGAGRLTTSPEALGQILARTGFEEPTAAATYLSTIPAARRAAEFNLLMKDYAGDNTLTLRTRRNAMPDGSWQGYGVYAAVSQKYAIHDGDAAMADLLGLVNAGTFGLDSRMSVVSNTLRHSLTIHLMEQHDVAKGETFSTWIRITTGDAGREAFAVYAGVTRLICLNGMTVAEEKTKKLSIRHSGDVATAVQQAILTAQQNTGLFNRLWAEALATPLLSLTDSGEVTPEEAVAGTYRGLLQAGKLSLPGYRGENAVQQFMKAFSAEPSLTRAGLINGATRAAHEANLKTLWASEEIEGQAGLLLTAKRLPWAAPSKN
jgi:Domain of unknown function (DUF932)